MTIPSSSGIAKARPHHNAYTETSAAKTPSARPLASTAGRDSGSVTSDSTTAEGLCSTACVDSGATTTAAMQASPIFKQPYCPEICGSKPCEIGRATSELQSRSELVCRLLLEKKK